eukprot:scaffold65180_cov18-Tisochrysis_lutea.AAC.1
MLALQEGCVYARHVLVWLAAASPIRLTHVTAQNISGVLIPAAFRVGYCQKEEAHYAQAAHRQQQNHDHFSARIARNCCAGASCRADIGRQCWRLRIWAKGDWGLYKVSMNVLAYRYTHSRACNIMHVSCINPANISPYHIPVYKPKSK